ALAAHLTIFAGAMWGVSQGDFGSGALLIVAAGQMLIGVTNAAGALAWNLGHNAFATADKAALYIGVHVMLAGLRGCLAPFIGVAALVSLVSLIGFYNMSRRIKQGGYAPVEE